MISEKIMQLCRKQWEKQSELSSLLVKEAEALKYKSKSEAKVKEQPTTKSLPPKKSGSIPSLFKAQQQKREKESTRRAEGNDDDKMTVQTGESKQGEQVQAGSFSKRCSEKNVENDLNQASSEGDLSKASQGTVAHVNVEKVCKGLQVPALTVSNECFEKRTKILPCQSISQQGRSRGDPGTATSASVEKFVNGYKYLQTLCVMKVWKSVQQNCPIIPVAKKKTPEQVKVQLHK